MHHPIPGPFTGRYGRNVEVGSPLSALRAVSEAHPKLAVRSSQRAMAFWLLLAAYIALTVCVLVWSPVLTFDEYLASLHLKTHHPGFRRWIFDYVMLGQRGPDVRPGRLGGHAAVPQGRDRAGRLPVRLRRPEHRVPAHALVQ